MALGTHIRPPILVAVQSAGRCRPDDGELAHQLEAEMVRDRAFFCAPRYVHPAALVVLLEGEARLVEWFDLGMVGFERSEDGSELLVLFAAACHRAHVGDTSAGTGWLAEKDWLLHQWGGAIRVKDAELQAIQFPSCRACAAKR